MIATPNTQNNRLQDDSRHHMNSMLMRESLVDKHLLESTDRQTPIVRMLPNVHVVKIGSRSILEAGHRVVQPVVDVLGTLLQSEKLILGVGGGSRSRHVFSIGLDLGLPTGVLAQLSVADALGNAHILGTLLAPHGVVAIPPEIFGHLLPLFIHSAPGVIFNGVPPYSLWEHPPEIGRIPKHRTDAGCFILAECFGCKSVTLVKDVKGLFTEDPKLNSSAQFIDEIGVKELENKNLSTPFDPVCWIFLNISSGVAISGCRWKNPETVQRAAEGQHVGTIIHAD